MIKKYAFVALAGLFYCLALFFFLGPDFKIWTDEEHFYFTILEFIQHPSLHTLQHYEEMSTPLPFILYAIWGWFFDTSLSTLRLLSLATTFFTILAAYRFFLLAKLSQKSSFLVLGILIVNPYFIGTGYFVYTDMFCLLFMILCFSSFMNKHLWTASLWLLLAILCRQYMLFFVPVFILTIWIQEGLYFSADFFKKISAILLPLIGVTVLFLFWNGTTPDNELKKLYIHQAFQFHGDAITAYMASSMIYTFPLLWLYLREFEFMDVAATVLISLNWYALFPVKGSAVALESMRKVETIGFFHKLVHRLPETGEHLVWYILFFFSCLVLVMMVRKMLFQYSETNLFVCICWIFFLITMSFSYLTWEKYLLPVLPVLLAYGALQLQQRKNIAAIH